MDCGAWETSPRELATNLIALLWGAMTFNESDSVEPMILEVAAKRGSVDVQADAVSKTGAI